MSRAARTLGDIERDLDALQARRQEYSGSEESAAWWQRRMGELMAEHQRKAAER